MANSINPPRVSLITIVTFLLHALVIVQGDNDDHGANVVSFNSLTFNEALETNKHFVMFYAPWCGHCKNLAPTWDELGKIYNKKESSQVTIGKVDCTVQTELCAEHEIIGFPTLKLFLTPTTVKRYAGKRDLESLRNYIEGHVNAIDPSAQLLQSEGSKVDDEKRRRLDGSETVEGDEAKPPVPKSKDPLVVLTDENFEETISTGMFFIKFYAPWCGHCQRLAPVWDDLANSFKYSDKVSIAKIDCTASKDACKEFGIRGYPTLLWFVNGEKVSQYQGARSHEALKTFVADEMAKTEQPTEEEEEDKEPADGENEDNEDDSKGEVKELTTENFDNFLSSRLVFVKFFAPWCGHCKRLAPTWDDLARGVEDLPASIAKVDCTQHKSVCDDNQVRGYPTLKIFYKGQKLEDYRGSRSLEDLHGFVKKHLESQHDEL